MTIRPGRVHKAGPKRERRGLTTVIGLRKGINPAWRKKRDRPLKSGMAAPVTLLKKALTRGGRRARAARGEGV